jgi:hypothetical protein
MLIQEMLSTHPRKPQMGVSEMASFIQTIYECADACITCADACLGEQQMQMLVRCIRLNQDCADVCEVTGKMLTRQVEPDPSVIRAQLQACIAACHACAQECERHAQMHEHCRICAAACRQCADACGRMLDRFPDRPTGALA